MSNLNTNTWRSVLGGFAWSLAVIGWLVFFIALVTMCSPQSERWLEVHIVPVPKLATK